MSRAFQFKQFCVYDSNSPMKVGTDAVLLGAWANISGVESILDIGTGCGIIALMLAQRSSAVIDAIDIDNKTLLDANKNISNSNWTKKINLSNISLQDFIKTNNKKFDLIISNPPFFNNSLKPHDKKKQLAKHNDSLPFDTLIFSIKKLLNNNGRFCLILPLIEFQIIKNIIFIEGLFINNITFVRPKKSKEINRVLAEIGLSYISENTRNELCIRNENNSFTEEYKKLTKDFYLHF